PDSILSARLPLGNFDNLADTPVGHLAVVLLPELISSSDSIPFESGDALDWASMLNVALDDPAPFLLARAAESRLLPSGVPAGALDRRHGRLIRDSRGTPAMVTRLSWIHAALASIEQFDVAVQITTSAFRSTTLNAMQEAHPRLLVAAAGDELLDAWIGLPVSSRNRTGSLLVYGAGDDATAAIDAGIGVGWLLRLGAIDQHDIRGQLVGDARAGLGTGEIFKLAADTDGDGVLSFRDILSFVEDVRHNNPRADLDLNGIIDLNDLTVFQEAYTQSQ
ncbi:MAG: hypothetical protein K8E66_10055, partial [Phycisphaerales bacterium]|nr:hypothetical protein [Phycisphaerales bacterium]